jgi:predicted permease
VNTQMLAVGPDFFTAMRIPLLTGRMLGVADMGPAQRTAIVNQAFVQRFVGLRNPIGLTFGGDDAKDPQFEIVGIVGDTKYADLRMENAPTAYIPLQESGATFAVRTAAPPAILIAAVRSVVNQIDSNLPLTRMKTQSETIDRLLFNERLVARLFGLFAVLGLVLACIGLYGLLSYEVARRTREIGIRTALGAQRRDVWVMVLRQGLLLVICGAVVGTGAAMVVTRLLVSLLYNVQPSDPGTLAAVAVLLVAVGIVACSMPARRATRVDPMVALRYE